MFSRMTILVWLAILSLSDGRLFSQEAKHKALSELKVLYVGSEHPKEYVALIKEHVLQVEAVDRKAFSPEQAKDFDVVLLSWPQDEETSDMTMLVSPLGSRDSWHHPTVLLGSAGLNLAVAWQMQGGSGCTCMDPLAYDLREHEIFEKPFPIDVAAMIDVGTPESFADEINETRIRVLPLRKGYKDGGKKNWQPGWCTYSISFKKYPDIEFFCGGVNAKTPAAAGLWRQGNLLHYGFELAPREMNDHARQLLLNSIAYISRFTQDRPIAITPSRFAGAVAYTRRTPAIWLGKGYKASWITDMFESQSAATLDAFESRSDMIEWCNDHAPYLYPKKPGLLGVDEDLQHIGTAFDTPEFFQRCLADLDASDPQSAERAKRLLERYVPCGPATNASADEWREWYKKHQPYLFALDAGVYRWYIDALAMERNIPSDKLRGPSRADR